MFRPTGTIVCSQESKKCPNHDRPAVRMKPLLLYKSVVDKNDLEMFVASKITVLLAPVVQRHFAW